MFLLVCTAMVVVQGVKLLLSSLPNLTVQKMKSKIPLPSPVASLLPSAALANYKIFKNNAFGESFSFLSGFEPLNLVVSKLPV